MQTDCACQCEIFGFLMISKSEILGELDNPAEQSTLHLCSRGLYCFR